MTNTFIAMGFISLLAIFITNLIAYETLRLVWAVLPRLKFPVRMRVLFIILPIFIMHFINIWMYAIIYFAVENLTGYGQLTGNIAKAELTFHSFIERLYFSASTYASLGLGDIIPTSDLRMLTSAQVLNGLVMIGWTVSFTYLTMEKFWLGVDKKYS